MKITATKSFWLLPALVAVLSMHGTAYAHPGGTAADGCHYCRTNCDSWGVPWNERHCHGGGGSTGGESSNNTYQSKPSCGRDSYLNSYGTCTSYPALSGNASKLERGKCPLGQFSVGDECLYHSNACLARHGFYTTETDSDSCTCKDGYVMEQGICTYVNTATNGRDEAEERAQRKIQESQQRRNATNSSSTTTGESVTVLSVVDGDTFKITFDGKAESVRIIGIDTPETVHPSKPVQCFGNEASAKMKELVEGQNVTLERNPAEDRDKYGRLLRYINRNGEDIGALMIHDGYAYSYKQYPHPRLEEYNELERGARDNSRGLWGGCEDGTASFADVPITHPYIQAIRWGKSSSALAGYADGSFKPDTIVNRAEFLKIVLAAKGIDANSVTNPTGFKDVDESAWYAPYLRYAKMHGIIQGYADGSFKPEQPVNFAEALKMAYVALGIEGDASASGEWYQRYLHHAQYNAVLFNNSADISAGMSRKDVVWIVWKLLSTEEGHISSSPSSVTTNNSCTIKGNISSNEEKIYHVEGCGSYDKTAIDESKGERWFCSEEDAMDAGWRKALNCS